MTHYSVQIIDPNLCSDPNAELQINPHLNAEWQTMATIDGVTLMNNTLEQIAKEKLHEYVEDTYYNPENLGEPDGYDEDDEPYWERDGEQWDAESLQPGPWYIVKARVINTERGSRHTDEIEWGMDEF